MKAIFNLFRPILIVLVVLLLFAGRTDCKGNSSFSELQNINETNILSSVLTVVSEGFLETYSGRQIQQPGDSLTKQELKQLKKEARAERRAAERAERNANKRVVDNPNHADYILLGEDLPRGRGILEAMSGRVPGMMISEGRVVVHGPSSFYGGGTALFLVDEIEVSSDYANSLSIDDIDRIEVFTGPSAAIYGSRVGTAVISIFTKNSTNRMQLED